jgi:hypothetical protein
MARCIFINPPKSCSQSEQDTFQFLQKLGPEFSIRWGFFYIDNDGMPREGDFVVQGLNGHLLILDAKAGACELNAKTGEWNTGEKGPNNNPLNQVYAERTGVLKMVRQLANSKYGGRHPYVEAVLALPNVSIISDVEFYQSIPRKDIVAQNDLENFEKWWEDRFSKRSLQCKLFQAKEIFNKLFSANAPDSTSSHTLDFASLILDRHTKQNFEILDALEENYQILFRGGPGTGKTSLAIEQASRLATNNMEVLFLCYNLELELYLKQICQKISEKIHVLSFESLAKKMLGEIRNKVSMNNSELTEYFHKTIPNELLNIVSKPDFIPFYDALIVDEAQDHNTDSLNSETGLIGWWSIYLRLLKKGDQSPVFIFYDNAQRRSGRSGNFDENILRKQLINPVNIRLRNPVRYTRQLSNYFSNLSCPATQNLISDFLNSSRLPEGPDPENYIIDNCNEGVKCSRIVRRWIDDGLAKSHEIAVLYPSSRKPPKWIGKIQDIFFKDNSYYINKNTKNLSHFDPNSSDPVINCYSINRAKGLERRAIILTGLPSWEDCTQCDEKAQAYVLGATRAQQLLAIVTKKIKK